jgi:hypothetical protein
MEKAGLGYNAGLANWKSQRFSYDALVEIIRGKIKMIDEPKHSSNMPESVKPFYEEKVVQENANASSEGLKTTVTKENEEAAKVINEIDYMLGTCGYNSFNNMKEAVEGSLEIIEQYKLNKREVRE